MRNIGFFLTLMLISVFTFAQEEKIEKGIAFSVGFHQTNSKGLFHTILSDEGNTPEKQRSATFFDVNVIFKKHDCSGFRFRPVYGIGVNQKGFVQEGN